MTKATKPPTQVAGVEGIAPKPIVLTPEPSNIDWMRIVNLPPFQMFAVEREPNLNGANQDTLEAWFSSNGPEYLYKQYCDWHKAKGYWPNETPMGKLIKWEA